MAIEGTCRVHGVFHRMCTFGILLTAMGSLVVSVPAQAQNADSKGTITFTPGFRLQPRYSYDNADANNDFYVARVRLKGKGDVYDFARYGVEIKIDNVNRFGKESSAQAENAWVDFMFSPDATLRAGLYDAAFSRNALTSDSKLLFMDRSLIKDALTGLGLADNTIGVLAHGRPWGGRFEYAGGIYDNVQFEQSGTATARQSDSPMSTGRIVFNVLDPATPGGYADYQSSYIGKGQRLSVGANAGFLPNGRIGEEKKFDLYAFGGDLFFNTDGFTFETEYDQFTEAMTSENPDVTGAGWYAQGGYLIYRIVELAARYQELDPDRNVSDNKVKWLSLGVNVYIREHNLKVQAEYTFKTEEGDEIKNDMLQVQLQMDF